MIEFGIGCFRLKREQRKGELKMVCSRWVGKLCKLCVNIHIRRKQNERKKMQTQHQKVSTKSSTETMCVWVGDTTMKMKEKRQQPPKKPHDKITSDSKKATKLKNTL